MPLSTLCEEISTTKPSTRPDARFRYIDVSSVSNETYRIVNTKELLGKDAPSRARQVIRQDDVIFATVRPTLRRVAMIHPELNGEVCSTGFCVLRARKEELSPQFLYFYLLTETVRERVEALQTGATYPAINDSDLFRLEIPLPSLAEQEAVVHALQAVQKTREMRKRELALERERKGALVDYLFAHGTHSEQTKQTDFGEIPESWRVLPLGTVVKFKSGSTRPKDLSDTRTEEKCVPVYGGNGIMGFTVQGSSNEKLLTIGRVGAYCGCVHIAEAPNWITDNALYSTQFFEDASVDFLAEQLKYLQLNQLKRAGAQPLVTQGVLHALNICLPPLADQKAIAEVLSACDRKIVASRREAELHEELFGAMVEELLSGRIGLAAMLDGAML